MRRVLKGDEDQVGRLIYQTRRNPDAYGVINYMAATNGFTMMDMVSCEQKHNEANGENNRDGSDYNYTWNCGCRGHDAEKEDCADAEKTAPQRIFAALSEPGNADVFSGR